MPTQVLLRHVCCQWRDPVVKTGFDGIITQIDWSPDGKTFAFTGNTGGTAEVWLMSDFLSHVKSSK